MERNTDLNKAMKKILFIILGSSLMAFNIKTFVKAGNLLPGGFNGLTILIQRIFSTFAMIEVPYSLLNYGLNLIPIFIGFKMVGKKFTLYSCLVVFLTGALVDIIPSYAITYDTLLITVFGGILNGTGIGLLLKGGASSGGTDFIAMYISKKFNTPSWNYVLGFNVIIQVVAGSLFGWDVALYSIIFQFVSTQVVNTLHITYKKVTLNIITTKADEMTDLLLRFTHHGITRFEGQGCYSKEPVTMLYTVISNAQQKRVMRLIHDIDPKAFINVLNTSMLDGRFYQEPIE